MKTINDFLEVYPIIYSENFLLRPYHYQDKDALYEIFSSKEIAKEIKNYHKNNEETKKYLDKKIAFSHKGKTRDYVIEKEGEVIGVLRLRFHIEEKEAELSYVIRKNYQKKGYAYHSCKSLLSYLFEHIDLEKVIAYVKKENLASIKVLEKLNFEKEKKLFSLTECYTLTKSQKKF